jgi:hypothetical protein
MNQRAVSAALLFGRLANVASIKNLLPVAFTQASVYKPIPSLETGAIRWLRQVRNDGCGLQHRLKL